MPYRSLDPEKIVETAQRLERRIGERFPDSGLCAVARELCGVAEKTGAEAEALAQPILWLRILVMMVIAAGATVFALVGTFLSFDRITTLGIDAAETVEATINTIILAGLGFLALVRLEDRIKEKRVLKSLHGLRSLIHVIDMHQLTKDPVAFTRGFKPTASSPQRSMSRSDLARYLDYCSEMLSLTGKLAALYAQSVNDSAVVEAVNDIENLGTNLSRKIWQKIMLIGEDTPAPRMRKPKAA